MGSLHRFDRRKSKRTGPPGAELGVLVSGLIEAGLIVPPLSLERRYLDQLLEARIEPDGSVTCKGRVFWTLSSAASYARSTCTGTPETGPHRLSSNGWSFWQFRNEDGELESMRGLRRRFLNG